MLIATKYEEIYPPLIIDFIYISKQLYQNIINKEEIIKMEFNILKLINFECLTVSSYFFLNRFHFISGDFYNKKIFYLAQYFIEICIYNINFCKFKNSIKAASCYYLARKIFYNEEIFIWNSNLIFYSGYKKNDFNNCLLISKKALNKFYLNKIFKNYKKSEVYLKFNKNSYLNISSFFDNFLEKKNKLNL